MRKRCDENILKEEETEDEGYNLTLPGSCYSCNSELNGRHYSLDVNTTINPHFSELNQQIARAIYTRNFS